MKRRSFLKLTGAACAADWADTAAGETHVPVSFPIVDTHVHFWDPENLDYGWLRGAELLNRPYLPADYTQAIAPVPVEKIVFVEAGAAMKDAMPEVGWVTELAKQDARIQGIVASAPLGRGDDAKADLEALARNPLVKGIRPRFPGKGELPPQFVEGVRSLEQVGFSCDICVGCERLPSAIELVRRCANVRFMLDHIGVPNIREGKLGPWRAHIRDLAALPNVCCKMSGVATTADRERWQPEDLEPAIDHVIECFGFERTAFGSDWPVMLLATTYPRWVEALLSAVRGCSETELRRLFRETATRFYRLRAEDSHLGGG